MSVMKKTKFPRAITLQITQGCNLRCKMCYYWGETGAYTKGGLKPVVMEFNLIKRIVEELSPAKPFYSLFGGEPLTTELIEQWKSSLPNSEIINLYGPTETTVSSHAYKFISTQNANHLNGVISIGKPFPQVECEIFDNENQQITHGEKGELCIAGIQTMNGYLKGDFDPFVYIEQNGVKKKYYRTGDLVQQDKDP